MTSAADAVHAALQQDEEWLRNFESSLAKSSQLGVSLRQTLDNLCERFASLEDNVLPLHADNAKIQKKQHNIQKLLKTIDSTIAFYGKTDELEASIRESRPEHNLKKYLEQMEQLSEAIAFFSSHPNYEAQLENMKLTWESGCSLLAKELRASVVRATQPVDPQTIFAQLDDNLELTSSKKMLTRTSSSGVSEMGMLASWLLRNTSERSFLQHYATTRGEAIMKTLRTLSQHVDPRLANWAGLTPSGSSSASLTSNATSSSPMMPQHAHKSGLLRQALRMAIGTDGSPSKPTSGDGSSVSAEMVLLMFAVLRALIAQEEQIMERVIVEVHERATVHRELVSQPLQRLLEELAGSGEALSPPPAAVLLSLLPLLKYCVAHEPQLHTLANNCHPPLSFDALLRTLRSRCSTALAEHTDRLRTDSGRQAPADATVHNVTSDTMHFLAALTQQRHVVTSQLLAPSAAALAAGTQSTVSSTLLYQRQFARILSALEVNLKRRAETYVEPAAHSIFLLNNYNYITHALKNEGLAGVLGDEMTQFYLEQSALHFNAYFDSWAHVMAVLPTKDQRPAVADRSTWRNVLQHVARELDTVFAVQAQLCVPDAKMTKRLRDRLRATVLAEWIDTLGSLGARSPDAAVTSRWSPEALDDAIDRLFDTTA